MLLEEKLKRSKENKLALYKPNKKQYEFHAAGKNWSERLFCAGNQLGKTVAGGMESAMHLTGLYPDWWPGMVFEKATKGWAASDSGESTRDNPQRILLGETEEEWGTGTIPKKCIKKICRSKLVGGVALIFVKHVSGGISKVQFKSYEQGRKRWQGPTIDWDWDDEEPPLDVYSEGLTRTNNGQKGQFKFVTFTPLQGMSNTVNRFLSEDPLIRGKFTHVTKMGIADAEHYSEEQKAQIIASYPAHEREARANGEPILGSGRVFVVPEEVITVDPFPIPPHWAEIGCVDFGGAGVQSHPASVVKLVHDRDNDTIYVVKVWRRSGIKLSDQASAARSMLSENTPVAWPMDGLQHDRKSGETYAAELKEEGINMLEEHAHMVLMVKGKEVKSVSVEGSVLLMQNRFEKGNLKVFSTCREFFEEYKMYHRKEGQIQKVRDDVICAVRYGIMMIRLAEVPKAKYGQTGRSLTLNNDDGRWVV